MSHKTKTLKLTYYKQFDEYKVEQIGDSVEYYPGQSLKKPEVQGLCDNGAWKVTIVSQK